MDRRTEAQISKQFTPATPITEQEAFSGRLQQLREVCDAVNQVGQHAVLYGERGVGKTSLANILPNAFSYGEHQAFAVRVNCDKGDGFSSIWGKVFDGILIKKESPGIGFKGGVQVSTSSLRASLPEGEVETAHVLRVLSKLPGGIIAIDEFDRVEDTDAKQVFADLIKALSDYQIDATVVLVGVAESIGDLIQEHASVERCMSQIFLPRMSTQELQEIITSRLPLIPMTASRGVPQKIAELSQGFPHYTHLLGRFAARSASERSSPQITLHDVKTAMEKAVDQVQASIRTAYREAVQSVRPRNLYREVLLACALVTSDEFGYFAAGDLRDPLAAICKRRYEIPGYSRHLTRFVERRILERKGTPRSYRFRFRNPLMRPYIYLHGHTNSMVPKDYRKV